VTLFAIALAMGCRNFYGLLVFAFVGYSAQANLADSGSAREPAERRTVRIGRSQLSGWLAGNRRRYGGYIAHFGVFFVALGIAASASLRTDHEATLKPGETMVIRGNTLRLSPCGREEKQRSVVGHRSN